MNEKLGQWFTCFSSHNSSLHYSWISVNQVVYHQTRVSYLHPCKKGHFQWHQWDPHHLPRRCYEKNAICTLNSTAHCIKLVIEGHNCPKFPIMYVLDPNSSKVTWSLTQVSLSTAIPRNPGTLRDKCPHQIWSQSCIVVLPSPKDPSHSYYQQHAIQRKPILSHGNKQYIWEFSIGYCK